MEQSEVRKRCVPSTLVICDEDFKVNVFHNTKLNLFYYCSRVAFNDFFNLCWFWQCISFSSSQQIKALQFSWIQSTAALNQMWCLYFVDYLMNWSWFYEFCCHVSGQHPWLSSREMHFIYIQIDCFGITSTDLNRCRETQRFPLVLKTA